MKRKFKAGGIILGVAVTALVVTLLWQIGWQLPRVSNEVATGQQPLAATSLSSAESPLPTSTAQPVGQPQSPLPPPTSPVLAQYKFSEPQFAYTAQKTNWIVNWLEDNQRVLLVEDTGSGGEYIEVLDTTKEQVTHYGSRPGSFRDPVWLETTQQVVFSSRAGGSQNLYLGKPTIQNTPQPVTDTQVLTGNADALQVAPIATQVVPTVTAVTPLPAETTPVPMEVTPIATQIAAMTLVGDLFVTIEAESGQVLLMDAADLSLVGPSVNVRDYGLEPRSTFFGIEPHPTKPEVAIYEEQGFLILNTETNEVQKLDLGIGADYRTPPGSNWALDAKWSPDGSTIAAIVVVGKPIFYTTRLLTLDIATGEVREISLPLSIVSDIAWAPNGKQLSVQGSLPDSVLAEHYLVDTETQTNRHLGWQLPDIYNGLTGRNLAWTADGSKLLFRCASSPDTLDTLSLCLVSVQLPKE